jgi:hypothetical protein
MVFEVAEIVGRWNLEDSHFPQACEWRKLNATAAQKIQACTAEIFLGAFSAHATGYYKYHFVKTEGGVTNYSHSNGVHRDIICREASSVGVHIDTKQAGDHDGDISLEVLDSGFQQLHTQQYPGHKHLTYGDVKDDIIGALVAGNKMTRSSKLEVRHMGRVCKTKNLILRRVAKATHACSAQVFSIRACGHYRRLFLLHPSQR